MTMKKIAGFVYIKKKYLFLANTELHCWKLSFMFYRFDLISFEIKDWIEAQIDMLKIATRL